MKRPSLFQAAKILWAMTLFGLLVIVLVRRSAVVSKRWSSTGRGPAIEKASGGAVEDSRRPSDRTAYVDQALAIVDSWGMNGKEQQMPQHGASQHDEAAPRRVATEKKFSLDPSNEHNYITIADFFGNESGSYFGGIQYKVVHKEAPRVLILTGALDVESCDAIIEEAKSEIARSEVVGEGGRGQVNSVRTSYGMFITRHADMPANLRLRTVVAAFAGIPEENIEATQVLRYEPGQFYRAHPDYFWEGQKEHLSRGGQRFATVLTWLNDVESGGETGFPSAADGPIRLSPVRGSSILFYSLKVDGAVDYTSMHEAYPPNNGSMKWVAVNWIRQHRFT